MQNSILLLRCPDIANMFQWTHCEKITTGWSNDEKYYLENKQGNHFLLRLSNASNHSMKQQEFNNLSLLWQQGLPIQKPISYGYCDNGESSYLLLSWIEGKDAKAILPALNEIKQYEFGLQAGTILHKIHSLPKPTLSSSSWEIRYGQKIEKAISNYHQCGIKMPYADAFLQLLSSSKHLLKNRPQTWQHGDYHLGNMVITPTQHLGIIDFNRADIGDPWEEFNRIIWGLSIRAPQFIKGQIMGYFNNNVPDDFWLLLALYLSTNVVSSISWAVPFGEEQVKIMQENAELIFQLYDGFTVTKPTIFG